MTHKTDSNRLPTHLRTNTKNIYIVDKNVFGAKIGGRGVYSISIRPEISMVQFPITEWCNLKCKRCGFYSNLVNDQVVMKLEDMEKDLKALRQKLSNIVLIVLIGGEPLSVANLNDYIYLAKSYFPNERIEIDTNGLKNS